MSEEKPGAEAKYSPQVTEKSDLVAEWERIQVKTFTGWANMHLQKRGRKINSVLEDFRDGTNLIELLDAIAEDDFPKGWVKKPKSRIHNVENLSLALKFIQNHDVKLASIGPGELADGATVPTLGMIWTIILRFVIAGLSEEGLSAKQGLLLWCQRKTEPYDNVNVQDFTYSFQDGLAFCALIHRHRPELIDYDSLSADNKLDNLNLAFKVAEEHLEIPKLLDAEDIVNTAKPEERSIMTYVAQLYKVFSSMDQAEVAGRRVGKFVNLAKQTDDMIGEYERRTTTLNESLKKKIGELGEAETGGDYETVTTNMKNLSSYKKGDKRKWIIEQSMLYTLFGNIQAKLKSMNRPKYSPPEGLSTQDVETNVKELQAKEHEHRRNLNTTLREILDQLRKDFAEPANAFGKAMDEYRAVLAKEDTLENQVAFFKEKAAELDAEQEKLPSIKEAEDKCQNANIVDNEYSDWEYDDLEFMHEQLVRAFDRKLSFVESTLQAQKSDSSVSPEQLQEFKDSYDHFDSDKDGKLSRLEFKSLLSSLGIIDIDFEGDNKEFEEIFQKIGGGGEHVEFDQFVEYMVKITADTASADQLMSSFSTIAAGKDYLTLNDLKAAQVDQGQIDYLSSVLPPKEGVEGGYDFKAWINEQYN